MKTLTITKPDDFHLHLRDGELLASIITDTAHQFARAIIMPNLPKPITTVELAIAYQARILASLPATSSFQPLMTLYLTDDSSTKEIIRAAAHPAIYAVKYYPAGATTHADSGVTDLRKLKRVLSTLEKYQLPLLLHGEVTDPKIDIFDRELVFIDRDLTWLIKEFPGLHIVLEHITTKEAVTFVQEAHSHLAATITPQHLLLNRNALFAGGGLRPHHYCLPLLKAEAHRAALVSAATSSHPSFFLGTDSAPHFRSAKESACGCAGIYSAYHALALYAEVFSKAGALDRLEAFSSHYGADFYRLPRNTETITLKSHNWIVPNTLPVGSDFLVPFRAGEQCMWQIQC